MRYWPYILRIYRNRQRILCMAEDGLCAREESTLDEFEGCREVPTTPLTLDNNDVNLLMPYIDSYRIQDARNNRFLRRQVDITNKIPTLMELFEQVPSSLRMDIEVKYPFQPKWDASLFLQTDAFEINGFVDSVLDVVFAFAPENREIAFSSFEPDVCIALALKQSRYDVLFLSDTEEQSDLKDYRSFYVSGAIQFASLQHLSGVSIAADTLTAKDQKHIPSTPIPPDVQSAYARRLKKIMQTQKPGEEEEGTSSIPTFDELLTVVQMEFEKRKKLFDATVHDNEAAVQFEKMWASFNAEYGRSIVKDAHRRGLKVWTWGGANSNHRYSCVQAGTMKVDGIITDDIPVVDTNEGDDRV
ncbi:Glycerophosphoryl diester phosphodiesterase family, putative [Angomonas deanei]|uniref:Glycerophosphoryl diester phosphodiesterase family, putative n=1 Tax=Angomonas deanei TaxID=59799 RepID=A0A7G2C5J5_9TRYP|nr:Glycerophosphoryl diester phosphodiesterase family, putative [Angomonas deanei]